MTTMNWNESYKIGQVLCNRNKIGLIIAFKCTLEYANADNEITEE